VSSRFDILGYARRNQLRLSPATLVQTLRCLRHTRPSGIPRILVNAGVSLALHESARFELDEQARLLLALGRSAGSNAHDPSTLAMGAEARFCVRGHARFLPGFRISIGRGARLELGSSWLNFGAKVFVRDAVRIGDRCSIGWGVTILDTDFHALGDDRVPRAVTIGDHVWIGAEAMVLKGVSIGDGAVIGARSVVTRSVPSRTLVAGQPARVIRSDVRWE
jgi:acetyltransferase-like isoleucine patch superfamily enzyme